MGDMSADGPLRSRSVVPFEDFPCSALHGDEVESNRMTEEAAGYLDDSHPDLQDGLMTEIASDAVLEEAYEWLCVRRQRYAPNNDVWTLRWRWAQVKEQVQTLLLTGQYRFDAMDMIPESEDQVALWSSRDALVLKALALVLTRHLGPLLPKSCCHVINNGGSKAAVRLVASRLRGQRFVFRTDVKWYYSSVDHDILYAQLQEYIADAKVLDLLWQYMHRRIYNDGLYEDVTRGIPMGCPLSPLMAAIYLKPLDERMAKKGWFYIRFMDDWVVLASTRWQLRAAVRCVNRTMAELKVEQHPDKTFVGRISRGFDFLGYRFSPEGIVGVAYASVQSCVQRIDRLYEQGADAIRIGEYLRWWVFGSFRAGCAQIGKISRSSAAFASGEDGKENG